MPPKKGKRGERKRGVTEAGLSANKADRLALKSDKLSGMDWPSGPTLAPTQRAEPPPHKKGKKKINREG